MNKGRIIITLPLLLIIIAIVAAPIPRVSTLIPVKDFFYAKILVYPNPGIPEPVLAGSELELRLKFDKDTVISDITGCIYDEVHKFALTFTKKEWSNLWNAHIIYMKVPEHCPEGFYSLTLEFKVNGKEMSIYQPNCVWVLKEWPKKIKLLYVADTKTPAGEPYWEVMARLTNLLKPTLMIFGGDEVDKPIYRGAWTKFLAYWLELKVPSYAGIGNHEYHEGKATIWKRVFGYTNYTVTVGKFLFILLDTGQEGWIPDEQLDWLENVLKRNPDKVKIAYMHHPIFSLKWKDIGKWYAKIDDPEKAFDYWMKTGFIYGSWKTYPEGVKRLFKLLIEHKVTLVLSGHIHQDLNVVIEYNNTKYYFITVTGVPFDVPEYVPRGFRLIEIYDNGTIVEPTLTYCGKAFNDYPTDIPVDVGEKVFPYKLGLIEFYYTPVNDGSSKAVSFKVVNPLDQGFENIYIAFRVSKEVPISEYKFIPSDVKYTVYEKPNYYLIVLNDVDLPPKSELKYIVYAVEDKDKPSIVDLKLDITHPLYKSTPGWFIGKVVAYDGGWGVDEVKVTYSNDGGATWKDVAIMDLVEDETKNGYVSYIFWIPSDEVNVDTLIKIRVTDFSGKSVEKEFKVGEVIGATTTPTTTPTTIPTPTPSTTTITITQTKTTTITKTAVETSITTVTEKTTTTVASTIPSTTIVTTKTTDYTTLIPLVLALVILLVVLGILTTRK